MLKTRKYYFTQINNTLKNPHINSRIEQKKELYIRVLKLFYLNRFLNKPTEPFPSQAAHLMTPLPEHGSHLCLP